MLAPSRLPQPLPVPAHAIAVPSGIDAILASELSLADGHAYDQFVATARSGHFSQNRAWAPVATAGKPFDRLFFLARRRGAAIGAGMVLRTRLGGLALPVAQIERGPVCAAPEDLAVVLEALRRCCRSRGILRLSVMPYWTGNERERTGKILAEAGFRDCQRVTGRHARALRLDLGALAGPNPFAGAEFVKLRKETRRAERAGAQARPGLPADLRAYCDMVATRDGHPLGADVPAALEAHFLAQNPHCAVFVCEAMGEAVSVIFAECLGQRAYFVAGASSGKDLPFSKMILPMAAAVLWGRDRGCTSFDFGGMPMAGDTDPKRNSIALFKRSFSRNEIDLVHEHVRWF